MIETRLPTLEKSLLDPESRLLKNTLETIGFLLEQKRNPLELRGWALVSKKNPIEPRVFFLSNLLRVWTLDPRHFFSIRGKELNKTEHFETSQPRDIDFKFATPLC